MKYLYHIALLLFLLSCGGVNQKEEPSFRVYNLDQEFEEMELSLSDLMDEPELVLLEATEESYLPDYFQFLIGEKYIITTDDEKMLLFNRDGSFVRKILDRGNGPEEFNGVNSMIFGSNGQKLFMSDRNSPNSLKVLDVSSSDFTFIDVPQSIGRLVMIEQNKALAFGYTDNYISTLFELDLISGKTNEIRRWDLKNDHSAFTSPIGKVGDDIFMLKSDTVSRYQNNEFTPIASFSVANKADGSQYKSGTRFGVEVTTPTYVLLSKNEVVYTQVDENSGTVSPGRSKTLYLDFNTNSISLADQLDFEKPAGFSYPIINRIRQQNDLMVLPYNAPTWLSIIEANSPHLPSKLIEQSQGLQMEDNPVLLIGKTK